MLAVRCLPAVTASLFFSFLLASPVVAQADSMLSMDGDTLILQVDQENGTPLLDLLALFERQLGVPIAYQEEEVTGVRVRMMGEVSVSRDGFRELLDRLVRAHGFVSWDAAEGEDPLITIAAVNFGRGNRLSGVRRWGHAVVPLDRLDEEPTRISALYTTVFPLHHIDARSAMSTFNPFFDTEREMVRSIEGSNSLLVTSGSLESLREIRTLLALVDVESSAVKKEVSVDAQQLAELGKKVEALEARLAQLEQAEK